MIPFLFIEPLIIGVESAVKLSQESFLNGYIGVEDRPVVKLITSGVEPYGYFNCLK